MKLLSLFFLIVALLWACNSSTEIESDSLLQSSKISDNISYTLSVNKTVFLLTDSIKIKFEVQNFSGSDREYHFNNIQQFGFRLKDENGNVALFYPLIVSPATSRFNLKHGETKTFLITWEFKDQNGNYIGRGDYELSAFLLDGNSPEVKLRISIL